MQKYNILNRVASTGLVAVVRADGLEEAIDKSKACLDGGIDIIEITFTVPKADRVIESLSESLPEALVGAGTVLDAPTARIAILAGAQFIVSPDFDLETAKLCNRYQIPYMAGCMTINEMVRALEAGVDVIKVFPGSAFGPDYIKAVKGPLPQVNLMPTGGVNLDNCDEWIKNGCMAVGIGGQLTNGTYEEIKTKAEAFVEKIASVNK